MGEGGLGSRGWACGSLRLNCACVGTGYGLYRSRKERFVVVGKGGGTRRLVGGYINANYINRFIDHLVIIEAVALSIIFKTVTSIKPPWLPHLSNHRPSITSKPNERRRQKNAPKPSSIPNPPPHTSTRPCSAHRFAASFATVSFAPSSC